MATRRKAGTQRRATKARPGPGRAAKGRQAPKTAPGAKRAPGGAGKARGAKQVTVPALGARRAPGRKAKARPGSGGAAKGRQAPRPTTVAKRGAAPGKTRGAGKAAPATRATGPARARSATAGRAGAATAKGARPAPGTRVAKPRGPLPGDEVVIESVEALDLGVPGAGAAVLSGGDLDADTQRAEDAGDEAVGGSTATPDQDVVDEIGRALGVEQGADEEVHTSAEILRARDRHYWHLERDAAGEEERA